MHREGSLRACVGHLGVILVTATLFACSNDPVPVAYDKGIDATVVDGGADRGVDLRITPEQGAPDVAPGDGPVPLDIGPSSESCSCQLLITKINNSAQIPVRVSSQDDIDPNTLGIQLNVLVQASCAHDGSAVELDVTGLSPRPKGTLNNGYVEFKGVTISTATSVVSLKALAASCGSNPVSFNVLADPTCTFVKPLAGATLTSADDTIPNTSSFDYTIEVATTNARNGKVTAKFASLAGPGVSNVDAVTGVARWVNQAIEPGARELQATVEVDYGNGLKLSAPCTANGQAKLSFTVNTSAPSCRLLPASAFTPPARLLSGGTYAFGPGEDADPQTAGIQTRIAIETDNGQSVEVTLEVGGQRYGPLTTTNGIANFDIAMADGAPTLRASCVHSTTKNSSVSGAVKPLVDATAPPAITDLACTINTALSHHRSGTLSCSWSNSDDGATGSGIESYALHCVKGGTIDAASFDAAPIKATYSQQPTTTQRVELSHLDNTKLFEIPDSVSCAVKARDRVANSSDISNVPAAASFQFQIKAISNVAPEAKTGDWFSSPMVVGNFNCDKWPDLAVGMQKANGSLGEVRIFFGHATGFSTQVVKIAGTFSADHRLGSQLSVGDFNGDACSDLAVAAKNTHRRVYVYLGRPNFGSRTDVLPTSGAELIYEAPAGNVLTSIAAGDFDGDGTDDLAVGHYDSAGNGFVTVDYGDKTLGLLAPGQSPTQIGLADTSTVDLTLKSSAAKSRLGASMIRLATTSAGGTGIMAIADYAEALQGGGLGAVYLVTSAPRGTAHEEISLDTAHARVQRIAGEAASKTFGSRLAAADLSGDGRPELVVSDPFWIADGVAKGRVYIFDLASGTPTDASGATATIANAEPGNLYLGIGMMRSERVGPGGASLLGDSKSELLLHTNSGTIATVLVFEGSRALTATSTDDAALRISLPGATAAFGQTITLLGDYNSDGHQDFALGDIGWPDLALGHGRLQIFH